MSEEESKGFRNGLFSLSLKLLVLSTLLALPFFKKKPSEFDFALHSLKEN
jgi:hypothetical protein